MPDNEDQKFSDKYINSSSYRPGYGSRERDAGVAANNAGAREQATEDKDAAGAGIRELTDEAIGNKSKLNENQNVNLGKNNPQGNLNNMSFGRTLALSRAADRYNNKPTGKITTMRGGSAVDGLQVSQYDPYNRPQIETEEMRQMQKNRRIDEARQMMRAALQGKVDQWTYDRYQDLAEQLALYNTSDYEFKNQINQFITQALVNSYVVKDLNMYNTMLKRYGILINADALLDIGQHNDAIMNLIGLMFNINIPFTQGQISTAQTKSDFIDYGLKKGYYKNYADAEADYYRIELGANVGEAEHNLNYGQKDAKSKKKELDKARKQKDKESKK